MLEQIFHEKIIAIIRGIESKYILKTAQALLDGGIRMMEITFDQSSEAGLKQTLRSMELVNREFGSDVLMGAGTVMSREQAEWAAERGAGYLISPNVDRRVIQRTKELGLISMPGALTPTEAVLAYQAGADIVKLFPAGVLGAAYIKALCAPLAQIPVAAVGGVDETNIASFFEAGVSCVGIGGSIVHSGRVRQGEYAAITEAAKGLRAQIES